MKTEVLSGTLHYGGEKFGESWTLLSNDGQPTDIFPLLDRFLRTHNGARAACTNASADAFALYIQPDSIYEIQYVPGKFSILKQSRGVGLRNLYSTIPSALRILNGRKVKVSASNMAFVVRATERRLAHRVHMRNGCGVIEKGDERTRCGFETADQCIFLAVSGTGFSCHKFDSTGQRLLTRWGKGKTQSTRIGDCAIAKRT